MFIFAIYVLYLILRASSYSGRPQAKFAYALSGSIDFLVNKPAQIAQSYSTIGSSTDFYACGELIAGGSFLTKIHHREIPALIRSNIVDAGVIWRTEAIYWGLNYSVPEPRVVGRLAMALMPWASESAKDVFALFKSREIREVYEKYGFKWVGK